jgi:hypothetical protein
MRDYSICDNYSLETMISRCTPTPLEVRKEVWSKSLSLIIFSDIKDYSKLWCELREKISLVKSGDKITPGQGTFGHIAGGKRDLSRMRLRVIYSFGQATRQVSKP